MRVVLSFAPGWGHLIPAVRLSRDVDWASVTLLSAPDFAAHAEGSADESVGIGPAWTEEGGGTGFPVELPLDVAFSIYQTAAFPATLAELDRVQPDVVVADVIDAHVQLAAIVRGLPLAIWTPSTLPNREGRAFTTLRVATGANVDYQRVLDRPALSQLPPSLIPVSQKLVSFRPEVTEARTSDRIVVTLGTVFASPNLWATVVDALAPFPLTLCNAPASSRAYRGDVQFAAWDDFAANVAGAKAVVCHGGAGTVVTALAHGVPVLALPMGGDQFAVASGLERSGAGLRLSAGSATPDAIQRSTALMMTEPQYSARARAIAKEFIACPSPSEALHDVVMSARPST